MSRECVPAVERPRDHAGGTRLLGTQDTLREVTPAAGAPVGCGREKQDPKPILRSPERGRRRFRGVTERGPRRPLPGARRACARFVRSALRGGAPGSRGGEAPPATVPAISPEFGKVSASTGEAKRVLLFSFSRERRRGSGDGGRRCSVAVKTSQTRTSSLETGEVSFRSEKTLLNFLKSKAEKRRPAG